MLEEFLEQQFSLTREMKRRLCRKCTPRLYAWAKKYELVAFKDSKVLIFKDGAEGDDDALALDRAQVVSHHGRVFEDLLKIHVDGGHCKAKTFLQRIVIAHGKSIPRWAAEAFVNCCPGCVRRLPRKPSSAGHKPILTKGLGSRGQVNLIDFQSCPDGSSKFLLNYQDHVCGRLRACPVAVLQCASRFATETPPVGVCYAGQHARGELVETTWWTPE